MNILLIPGMLIRHNLYPEWGVGQIQSCTLKLVTINFENVGKKVLQLEYDNLEIIQDD